MIVTTNQILSPAGLQVIAGGRPTDVALAPNGRWLAVLHAGHGEHEVVILDLRRQKIVSRAALDQAFYGLCFSPDGGRLFASGGEHEVVHFFDFADGYLGHHREVRVAPEDEKFIACGVAINAAGTKLFVAGPWGHCVRILPLDEPNVSWHSVPTGKDSYPYTCLPDQSGKFLYVSLWNQAAVAVIDLREHKVADTWPTET